MDQGRCVLRKEVLPESVMQRIHSEEGGCRRSIFVASSVEGGQKAVSESLIKRDVGGLFAEAPRAEEPCMTTGDGEINMEKCLAFVGHAQEPSSAAYNLQSRSGLAPPERLSFDTWFDSCAGQCVSMSKSNSQRFSRHPFVCAV